jgi:hypothetical protein
MNLDVPAVTVREIIRAVRPDIENPSADWYLDVRAVLAGKATPTRSRVWREAIEAAWKRLQEVTR